MEAWMVVDVDRASIPSSMVDGRWMMSSAWRGRALVIDRFCQSRAVAVCTEVRPLTLHSLLEREGKFANSNFRISALCECPYETLVCRTTVPL